jgi:hypothetical protein
MLNNKGLHFTDSDSKIPIPWIPGETFWFDTVENTLKRWDGAAWESVSWGATGGTVTEIDTESPIGGGPITTTGTIFHEDSGVDPGTYGDDTNVAQVVVDETGHIVEVYEVPISGIGSPGGTAAAWTLIEQRTVTNSVEDFIDLGACSDLRVITRGLTADGAGARMLLVSTDNGSTFLNTTGDYVGIAGNGLETNYPNLLFQNTGTTAGLSGVILIEGFNMSNIKSVRSNFFGSDAVMTRLIPTTSPLNAIQVRSTVGNLTGGTIWVLGR